MPRSRRLDYPGAKHHLISRGARREPIFSVPGARSVFLELLSELPERFGMRIHAYALMGNHYHLLATSPEGGLAGPMQRLDQTFTQRLNAHHGWDGPVFRGRYVDVLVADPSHWEWLLAYVHLNPERSGFEERVSDPMWTSHPAYLGEHRLRRWLDPSEHLRMFGGEQGYAAWLSAVSLGRIAAPDNFLPERPATGMGVVPAPQVDADPLTLLCQVEAVCGCQVPRGFSREPIAWVAAWWLRANGVSLAGAADLLSVDASTVSRRVDRALHHAKERRALAGWMAALCGEDPAETPDARRSRAA